MRHLALAAAAVLITGCAPAHVKQVATKPVPSPFAKADSACPIFIVDGVEQGSACAAPLPAAAPKCEASTPMFIVDGVEQPSACTPLKRVPSSP